MNRLSLSLLLTIATLLAGMLLTWQRHVDMVQRQCERLAEHVAVLERLVLAEHPNYSTWITWEEKCP